MQQDALGKVRAEAQRYIDASRSETEPDMKRNLANAGFALAQLAEQLGRGRVVTDAHIEQYKSTLMEALGLSDVLEMLDTLLGKGEL